MTSRRGDLKGIESRNVPVLRKNGDPRLGKTRIAVAFAAAEGKRRVKARHQPQLSQSIDIETDCLGDISAAKHDVEWAGGKFEGSAMHMAIHAP